MAVSCDLGRGFAGRVGLGGCPPRSPTDPYGGFSPVRLQMDRQWRPSTTSRGLILQRYFLSQSPINALRSLDLRQNSVRESGKGANRCITANCANDNCKPGAVELSAVHIRPTTPSYTPPQLQLPGIRDPRSDYPFENLSVPMWHDPQQLQHVHPEALGSPSGYVVPAGHRLLRPHPSL